MNHLKRKLPLVSPSLLSSASSAPFTAHKKQSQGVQQAIVGRTRSTSSSWGGTMGGQDTWLQTLNQHISHIRCELLKINLEDIQTRHPVDDSTGKF